MKLVDKNDPVLRTAAQAKSFKQEREVGRRLLKFVAFLNRRKDSPSKCVGLAANQVGLPGRVCIVLSFVYGELVLINPKIISSSETLVQAEESCLSLPGEVYSIERPVWCVVETDNRQEPVHFGPKPGDIWNDRLLMDARIVQHEICHLQGILISDIGKKI